MTFGRRRRILAAPFAGLLATMFVAVVALSIPAVDAQDPLPPLPVPDPTNNTTTPGPETPMQITIETENAFARIPERGLARYTVVAKDTSVAGTQAYAPQVFVTCGAINQTQGARGWSFVESSFGPLSNGETQRAEYMILSGARPTPEFYEVTFECSAGAPVNDVVGRFTLRAQAGEYVYMAYGAVNTVGKVGPDEAVDFTVKIQNGGNQIKRYIGRIDAPDGWIFPSPPPVILEPGETREVTVTGISARDQILYISNNGAVQISYYPDGQPGKAQTAFFPVSIKGVYMHPALLPLTVLALTIIGSLVFLAVLARRAIEEQILGKPVPPWRIPVEREMLAMLQKKDPDQFYIMRYYLMVEEHESALLWFNAYKKATKKDRKREREWYKVKTKQERKIRGVEKQHAKVGKAWDRKIHRVEKKRDRKIRKLERKLRRGERKDARGLDQKHKKRVKKIQKRHKKRVKKINKKHERLVAKETKKVDKQNRKLAKKGEALLPLPEIPPPEIEEPEIPDKVPVEETPLEESKYAKRADRIRERAEAKMEKIRLRKERVVAKDRLRSDNRIEKLESKIPPEPKTHLYDEAEYVPAHQVIVEDDRPLVSKLLHVPTLEEREQMRRRRSVYQARLQEAKASDDPERVERIKQAYKEELAAMKQARRDELAASRASSVEAARLKKEQKRQLKERAAARKAGAKDIAPVAAPKVPTPREEASATAPKKTLGLKIPVGRRRETADPDAPERAEAPAEAPTTGGAAEADTSDEKGFRARFKRRPKEEAGSEEDKKEPVESPETPPQGRE